jgi:hypothetical protein
MHPFRPTFVAASVSSPRALASSQTGSRGHEVFHAYHDLPSTFGLFLSISIKSTTSGSMVSSMKRSFQSLNITLCRRLLQTVSCTRSHPAQSTRVACPAQ